MRPTLLLILLLVSCETSAETPSTQPTTLPAREIQVIHPPEKGFFSKRLDYEGIAIKAHQDVSDAALREAYDRLSMMLANLPTVRANLAAAGAELHIIGKDQVTSDLPEFRQLKGKPFDGKLTVDQRTRGLGGLLTSCGEENLLRLIGDRYRGRDICVHEFAHNILATGVPESFRRLIRERYRSALLEGLWVGAYAGTNYDEFFAETNMWYFGTHGDLNMKGFRPANGPEGLKAYDPQTFAILEKFYSGKMDIPLSPRARAAAATQP